MTCKNCIHYSARGKYEDGIFVQNITRVGTINSAPTEATKTGWCQYGPPLGSREQKNVNDWPIVTEDERCGKFEEEPTPSYYKHWYYDVCKNVEIAERKLKQSRMLHEAVGELGPLVGKKTNSVRLQIIKAVKEALEKQLTS